MSTAMGVLKKLSSGPQVEFRWITDSQLVITISTAGETLWISFLGGGAFADKPDVLVDLVERSTRRMWSLNLVGNWLDTMLRPPDLRRIAEYEQLPSTDAARRTSGNREPNWRVSHKRECAIPSGEPTG